MQPPPDVAAYAAFAFLESDPAKLIRLKSLRKQERSFVLEFGQPLELKSIKLKIKIKKKNSDPRKYSEKYDSYFHIWLWPSNCKYMVMIRK